MSDFRDFINLLYRHRYIILVLPLVTIIITYFLVRNLPDVYSSKSRIETGISDQTENLLNNEVKLQKAEIDQKFTNLTQLILLRKVVEQVSYKLILHDLTAKKPFRIPSDNIKQLSSQARKRAISIFTAKHASMTEISTYNRNEIGLSNLIESMGYDYGSLSDAVMVYRANNSDFVDIKFDSENPELSAFVANTLCQEFIAYHKSILKKNQGTAVNYLSILLQMKLDTLNNRMKELKQYKTKNRILYLNEQAHALFGQIKDFETLKESAEQEVTSYTAAIKDIDSKFNPNDRKYLESTITKINGDIIESKIQLKALNDKYFISNFDVKYKSSIDSLRNILTSQINQSTDKYIYSPMVTKQALVSRKLEMEISLDISKNGLISLDNELKRLNKRFDELVPHEAMIQSYERGVDVATREYIEILGKYNQTNMAGNYAVNLRQIEVAMPGSPAPAKRILLVIISGIVTFVFCLIIFFVIFYLDEKIKTSKELAFKTAIPVLGHLPFIKYSISELINVLNEGQSPRNILEFKDLLRSVRFEIDQEMDGMKQLAVTSIKTGEGKTMFSTGLAYAYSLTNKKVLMIDGNFENFQLSKSMDSEFYLEDFLDNSITTDQLRTDRPITLLANRGGDISLFELNNEVIIRQKLNDLEQIFDIIIIDTPPLSMLNKAGEWILVANKVVAVFEANKSISREMRLPIDYLKTLDKFIGWVLNKVTIEGDKVEKKKRKSSKVIS